MQALTGMDRHTGKPITGVVHLKQSIGDILSTRKGTRRERPEYGSDIPTVVDLPVTRGWISLGYLLNKPVSLAPAIRHA